MNTNLKSVSYKAVLKKLTSENPNLEINNDFKGFDFEKFGYSKITVKNGETKRKIVSPFGKKINSFLLMDGILTVYKKESVFTGGAYIYVFRLGEKIRCIAMRAAD